MELFLTIIFCIILFFWLLGRFGPLLLAWWLKRRIEKMAGTKDNFMAFNLRPFSPSERCEIIEFIFKPKKEMEYEVDNRYILKEKIADYESIKYVLKL